MADLSIPLLDNQNQFDNVSITISSPLASPLPSPPLPSPNSSPLRQYRNNLIDPLSPNSSPNGLFVSLGSCCPRSILFNPRSANVRPFRLPALSQTNDLQASTPQGHPGNLKGIEEEATGDVVGDSTTTRDNDPQHETGQETTGESTRESLPTSTELDSYRLGIVDIPKHKKLNITKESELKELWKLVLERRKLQEFVQETIKCGREHSKILGFVGSLVVLFSTIIDAELNEDISGRVKLGIFSVFSSIFIVYMWVSNLQLHYIYEPSLSHAQRRYENLLFDTNIVMQKLVVADSEPKAAVSIRKEGELRNKFDKYCEEIGTPLMVRLDRHISFIELNFIAIALAMAFIFKGMSSKPKP